MTESLSLMTESLSLMTESLSLMTQSPYLMTQSPYLMTQGDLAHRCTVELRVPSPHQGRHVGTPVSSVVAPEASGGAR